ncbi:UNVERIFIED_ORG: hypothetical protein J3D58_003296 [Paenarthrobacter nicotinovorans]
MNPMKVLRSTAATIGRIWRNFWSEGPRYLLLVLRNVLVTLDGWLMDSKKATYGLAVTRMLLAITALGLLATNFSTRFYTFGSASAWTGELESPRSPFPGIWLFSAFHELIQYDVLFTLLYLFVGVLAIALLLGYRTRIVLPAFWVLWVSLIELQDMVSDQGDNIFRIALLGLVFADSSMRWSLDARRRARAAASASAISRLWQGAPVLPQALTNLSHNLVVVILTCQVAFVYVAGALFKAGGTVWQNGTAVYYPLHVARFAPWPELSELVSAWAPAVAIASIGSILIQLLFPGALLFRWTRIPVLFAMVGFHFGIAVLMGLPWFSLAMVAIDSIFVRDVTWQRIANWVRGAGRVRRQSRPRRSAPDQSDNGVIDARGATDGDLAEADMQGVPMTAGSKAWVPNVNQLP